MPPEPGLPFPPPSGRRARVGGRSLCLLCCALAAVLLVACRSSGTADATAPIREASPGPAAPAAPGAPADSTCPAAAVHQALHDITATERGRERSGAAPRAETPLQQLQAALVIGRSRHGDLVRAMVLLDTILTSRAPEAAELRPIAQLLAEQYAERLRAEAVTERLTQQLERTGQQLKDAQRRGDELQAKLEALTDIERRLPARPSSPPLPELPDRRNP